MSLKQRYQEQLFSLLHAVKRLYTFDIFIAPIFSMRNTILAPIRITSRITTPLLLVIDLRRQVVDTHARRRELIRNVPIRRDEIDREGVSPRRDEEHHRDHHGESRAAVADAGSARTRGIMCVCCRAEDDGDDGAAADATDDEAAAAFAVLAQAAHAATVWKVSLQLV